MELAFAMIIGWLVSLIIIYVIYVHTCQSLRGHILLLRRCNKSLPLFVPRYYYRVIKTARSPLDFRIRIYYDCEIESPNHDVIAIGGFIEEGFLGPDVYCYYKGNLYSARLYSDTPFF